ncbi:MAG: hypothetical protein ACTSRI_16430 [Promethearchaeota archaeon]
MKNKSVILILFMLFSITAISLMSLSTITVVADEGGGPPFMDWERPPPPTVVGRNESYWDFNNDTVIGWRITMEQDGSRMSMNMIFNISSMKYLINASGDEEHGYKDFYGVMLNQMYFNTSTNSLKEYTNHTIHPIINASLINYTNTEPSEMMVPFNLEAVGGAGPLLNAFIPKNNSRVLDLHWCANATRWLYGYFLTNGTEKENPPTWGVSMSVDTSSNSTHYWSNTWDTYAHMFYYPNGTLRTGEMKAYIGDPSELQTPMTINMTRIFDFNPLDDLEWSVDVGDVFYMGMQGNESKIEIVEFHNFTTDENYNFMNPIALQEVIANVSQWDKDTEIWNVVQENGTIGVANEDYPLVFKEESFNMLVPNRTTGSELAESCAFLTSMYPDITFEYGDYWVKIINDTTPQGILYWEFFPDGILKYFYTDNFEFGPPDSELVFYFLNNITINGEHSAKIYPFGTDEFQITVNISVSADKLLLYSGFHRNPFDVDLKDGLVFIDVMLNDTGARDPPINITIKYNEYKYENINLWWFNRLADGGNGAWEVVAFTDLGDGKIIAFVDHTSVFALTGTEIPPQWNWNWNWNFDFDLSQPPPTPSEISFGYFFLIFGAIGIIGLAIYKKRKI